MICCPMTSWRRYWAAPALMLRFFFFQAEDGIRDYKVTGVQTCALPIYAAMVASPMLSKTRQNAVLRRHYPRFTPALPALTRAFSGPHGHAPAGMQTGHGAQNTVDPGTANAGRIGRKVH